MSLKGLEAPRDLMTDKDGKPMPSWYGWFATVANVLLAVTGSGTTAQRPTKFLYLGRNFWNTDTAQMEWYDGAAWVTYGGGGGAPTNATYVTMSLNGALSAERVLTAGANITITDGGANGPVTIASTAGGAPVGAQYVTLALDGTLTAERRLQVGSPITMVDGGANADVTLDFDETVTLGNNARVAVSKNSGLTVGTRRRLNLIEGAGVTLTVADDGINEEVDVTIAASAGTAPTAGSVTVDFGFSTGGEGDIATAAVALPAVLVGSKVQLTPCYSAGLDHDPDDYAVEGIQATVGAITAGVGFDVIASARGWTWGRYNVNYLVTI